MTHQALKWALVLSMIGNQAMAADMSFYGRLKASVIATDKGVNSFGNENLSAPTSSSYQGTGASGIANHYQQSFQTAQSRFGINVQELPVKANLEFDFITFTKATPTTQANPRVRRAFVRYEQPTYYFQVGQDWDTFSPLMPDTYDYVGLYFEAGNAGFQRQQIKFGQRYYEISVGFPGNNPNASNSFREQSSVPTLAFNLHTDPDREHLFGISGIYSPLRRTDLSGEVENVHGGNLYHQFKKGAFKLTTELSYGQSLGKIAVLTLANSAGSEALHEWFGYTNASYQYNESNKLVLGFGMDKITNTSRIGLGTDPAMGANHIVRASHVWNLAKSFDLWVEGSYFKTQYKRLAVSSDSRSSLLETGFLYTF